jgi:S1-C subfamily serine protease
MAARFEVEETEGFYITDLEKGLGADLAGLEANDIIKSVDGIKINEFADLSGYLATKRPGEKVSVVFRRDGKEKKVDVRLEKINRALFYYMEVRPLNSEQKNKYNTEYGLYISNMNNRRLYQRGIDNGYILLEVNGKEVNQLSDLKNIESRDIEDLLFLSPSGEKKIVLMQY